MWLCTWLSTRCCVWCWVGLCLLCVPQSHCPPLLSGAFPDTGGGCMRCSPSRVYCPHCRVNWGRSSTHSWSHQTSGRWVGHGQRVWSDTPLSPFPPHHPTAFIMVYTSIAHCTSLSHCVAVYPLQTIFVSRSLLTFSLISSHCCVSISL